MNMATNAVWVVDLDNLPTEGFKNPLELGIALGIGRRETLLFIMAISDALLGLCGALPTLLSDLRDHTVICYSDVIEKFMQERIHEDDYPEDIRLNLPGHMLQLKSGIIDWAIGLIGQTPKQTCEIQYVCQVKQSLVLLKITQDFQNDCNAYVQRQVSESLSQPPT